MNAAVHAPMYAYFAAVEWAAPHALRRTAMAITSLQCAQMVAGLALCLASNRLATV